MFEMPLEFEPVVIGVDVDVSWEVLVVIAAEMQNRYQEFCINFVFLICIHRIYLNCMLTEKSLKGHDFVIHV